MSFSSTPIGQGRRLDQHTFLNRPQPAHRSPNKPNSASSSFSYGSGPAQRSPGSTLSRTRSHTALQALGDEQDEPALVRYARLKQRNQSLSSTRSAGSLAGPGIITSPPKPHEWSVRDTTVNVATAFYQAAESVMPAQHSSQTPNGTWATGARVAPNVPRSTSVEYEAERQAASSSRRLAPPPPRGGHARARPLAKSQSMRSVPDSEGEEEVHRNTRGKSPFEQMGEIAKRGLQAATYYVRRRSEDPDAPNGSYNLDADASTSRTMNDSNSYDYAAEEASFRSNGGKPLSASKRGVNNTSAAHRKNRISIDNKAYRPSVSDYEDSDEDFEDDDGKKRKKKKKRDATGGPLTSLPVVGPDKRRKGTKKSKTRPDDEDDAQEEEEEEEEAAPGNEVRATSGQRSVRSQTPLHRTSVPPPPSRQSSAYRGSVPPSGYQEDMMDTSGDMPDSSLDPILEVDDELPIDTDMEEQYARRARSKTPRRHKGKFSVGALLGACVNLIARLVGFFVRLLGRAFTAVLEIFILKPVNWLASQGSVFGRILAYLAVGFAVLAVLSQLWAPIVGLLPSLSRPAVYQPPSIPAADIAELAARLQSVENVLSGLSMESERARSQRESEGRAHKDTVARVAELETRVQKEVARAQEAEVQHLAVSSASLQSLRNEMLAIAEQIQKMPVQGDTPPQVIAKDEETLAKLLELETRLGGVEGGVKEALELGKHSVKAGGTTGEHWWSKIGSGNSGLTIKSSDGQDVTSLIGQLVDSAVSLFHKDVIARPDFALYSAGARIIPSLTSETVFIKPRGLRAKMLGILTNEGHGIGRSPVVALHPDTHSGNCWPSVGAHGQLGVALASPVYITDITIDHIAKELALDVRSAPRQMELWGLVEGKDNLRKVDAWKAQKRERQEREKQDALDLGLPPPAVEGENYPGTLPRSYMKIANFTYNVHASHNIQTFPVPQEIRDLDIDFGVVVLMIKNNWGMDSFTCIYRLRVHGQRMGEIPLPYPEDVI